MLACFWGFLLVVFILDLLMRFGATRSPPLQVAWIPVMRTRLIAELLTHTSAAQSLRVECLTPYGACVTVICIFISFFEGIGLYRVSAAQKLSACSSLVVSS